MPTKNELLRENKKLKKEVQKYKKRSNILAFSTLGAVAVTGFSIGTTLGAVEAASTTPVVNAQQQDVKEEKIESSTYVEEKEINEKISFEADTILASTESEYSYSDNNDYDSDYDDYLDDNYKENNQLVHISSPSTGSIISSEKSSIQEDNKIEEEASHKEETSNQSEKGDFSIEESTDEVSDEEVVSEEVVSEEVVSEEEVSEDEVSDEEISEDESSDEESSEEDNILGDIITFSEAENNIFNLFEEGVKISIPRLGGTSVIFNKEGTDPIQRMLGSNAANFEFAWNHEFYVNSYNYTSLGCYENIIKLVFDVESMENIAIPVWEEFQAAIELSSEECEAIFREDEMQFAYSMRRMTEYMQESILNDEEALKEALKAQIKPLIGDFELEIEFARFRK